MVDRTYNEDEGDSFTDSDSYMTDDAKPGAPLPEEDYGAETIDRIMDYRKGKVGSKYYYIFFLKSKVRQIANAGCESILYADDLAIITPNAEIMNGALGPGIHYDGEKKRSWRNFSI